MVLRWVMWQDEGLEPELVRGPFTTSRESTQAAKRFVQSKAWTPQEDGLYELVVEGNEAFITGWSNGDIEEWEAQT